jgi:hypothetical protein
MPRVACTFLSLLATAASGAEPKPDTARVKDRVVVRGIVISGILTESGKCPHDYWLALAKNNGKSSGSVALRPTALDLSKYLNKLVEIKGDYGLCTETEIAVPFLTAQEVNAIRPSPTSACMPTADPRDPDELGEKTATYRYAAQR